MTIARREEMRLGRPTRPTRTGSTARKRIREKREDAFRRRRAAEHVADIPRIRRPIRAEFEFHDDARGHADGERERKHLRPEPRHLVIDRVLVFSHNPSMTTSRTPSPMLNGG